LSPEIPFNSLVRVIAVVLIGLTTVLTDSPCFPRLKFKPPAPQAVWHTLDPHGSPHPSRWPLKSFWAPPQPLSTGWHPR